MELKELRRNRTDNRYCGPAVLAFISGWTTGDTACLLRLQTGRRQITWASTSSVLNAYSSLGYSHRTVCRYRGRPTKERPTLAAWLKDTVKERTAGRMFLIVAGNHFQLVTGRRYACGRIGEIVSIKDPRVKRRARIEAVYELFEMQDRKEIQKNARARVDAIQSQKQSRAATRTQARKLAAQIGVGVDLDDFGGGHISIYLDPPEWMINLREDGVVDYETVAYDWEGCIRSLSEMKDIMEEYRT